MSTIEFVIHWQTGKNSLLARLQFAAEFHPQFVKDIDTH